MHTLIHQIYMNQWIPAVVGQVLQHVLLPQFVSFVSQTVTAASRLLALLVLAVICHAIQLIVWLAAPLTLTLGPDCMCVQHRNNSSVVQSEQQVVAVRASGVILHVQVSDSGCYDQVETQKLKDTCLPRMSEDAYMCIHVYSVMYAE